MLADAALWQVGRECGGSALNPNELSAVIRVVDALADSPPTAVGGRDDMLVPDVGGRLVPASACFRADNPQARAHALARKNTNLL